MWEKAISLTDDQIVIYGYLVDFFLSFKTHRGAGGVLSDRNRVDAKQLDDE